MQSWGRIFQKYGERVIKKNKIHKKVKSFLARFHKKVPVETPKNHFLLFCLLMQLLKLLKLDFFYYFPDFSVSRFSRKSAKIFIFYSKSNFSNQKNIKKVHFFSSYLISFRAWLKKSKKGTLFRGIFGGRIRCFIYFMYFNGQKWSFWV